MNQSINNSDSINNIENNNTINNNRNKIRYLSHRNFGQKHHDIINANKKENKLNLVSSHRHFSHNNINNINKIDNNKFNNSIDIRNFTDYNIKKENNNNYKNYNIKKYKNNNSSKKRIIQKSL